MLPLRRPAALLSAALLLSLATACDGGSGEVTPDSPEGVTDRFLGAMQSQDFEAAASLMHPGALEDLKGLFAPLVEEGTIGVQLLGVQDAAEFEELPPQEMFGRFMDRLLTATPGMAEMMESMSGSIVGSVTEGDTVRHMVVRSEVTVGEEVNISQMQVMSLKRYEDTWRVLLTAELGQLAEFLSRLGQQTT